jgi:hypothetical protein
MMGYGVPAPVAARLHEKVLEDSVWFQLRSVDCASCGVWQKEHKPVAGFPRPEKSWAVPRIPPPGAVHAMVGARAMRSGTMAQIALLTLELVMASLSCHCILLGNIWFIVGKTGRDL